jgi:hypothetical protein
MEDCHAFRCNVLSARRYCTAAGLGVPEGISLFLFIARHPPREPGQQDCVVKNALIVEHSTSSMLTGEWEKVYETLVSQGGSTPHVVCNSSYGAARRADSLSD